MLVCRIRSASLKPSAVIGDLVWKCSLEAWLGTFVVLHHSNWGVVLFEFSFLPLAQHLLLEVSHCFQEVFALHVWGWNDDAVVQELIDAIQQVLSVVSKVGHLMEVLQQNTTGCQYQNAKERKFKIHMTHYLARVWDSQLKNITSGQLIFYFSSMLHYYNLMFFVLRCFVSSDWNEENFKYTLSDMRVEKERPISW